MRIFLFVVALGLTGCMPDQEQSEDTSAKVDTPPNLAGECPADTLQGLIGQTYAEDLIDYDGRIRVIPPGSAVTMDFLPGRLNISTDADGVIRRITCG